MKYLKQARTGRIWSRADRVNQWFTCYLLRLFNREAHWWVEADYCTYCSQCGRIKGGK